MVAKLIYDVVSLLDRRRRERRIRNELEALTDEDLAELRIERDDISYIARQTIKQNY